MKAIYTDQAPQVLGTYSQAIKSGNTIYFAGQIAFLPETETLINHDIQAQMKQVFKNIKAVCEASGGRLKDIVKLTVYLLDLNHAPLLNQTMAEFFEQPYPARTTIGVSALPKEAQIEIDAIAVLQ